MTAALYFVLGVEVEVDQGVGNEPFATESQAAVADLDTNSCFINKYLY